MPKHELHLNIPSLGKSFPEHKVLLQGPPIISNDCLQKREQMLQEVYDYFLLFTTWFLETVGVESNYDVNCLEDDGEYTLADGGVLALQHQFNKLVSSIDHSSLKKWKHKLRTEPQ